MNFGFIERLMGNETNHDLVILNGDRDALKNACLASFGDRIR